MEPELACPAPDIVQHIVQVCTMGTIGPMAYTKGPIGSLGTIADTPYGITKAHPWKKEEKKHAKWRPRITTPPIHPTSSLQLLHVCFYGMVFSGPVVGYFNMCPEVRFICVPCSSFKGL